MAHATRLFRLFLGASALLAALLISGCKGEPVKITEEEFFSYATQSLISEVTIHKPASEGAAAKVEGRFRREPEGKPSLFFELEMKIDKEKTDQLKTQGIKIDFAD